MARLLEMTPMERNVVDREKLIQRTCSFGLVNGIYNCARGEIEVGNTLW